MKCYDCPELDGTRMPADWTPRLACCSVTVQAADVTEDFTVADGVKRVIVNVMRGSSGACVIDDWFKSGPIDPFDEAKALEKEMYRAQAQLDRPAADPTNRAQRRAAARRNRRKH